MKNTDIVTPQSDPDHAVVGHWFLAYDSAVYYADSYDPSCGYWMTRSDGSRRTNISERAVGRTFHEIHERDGKKTCGGRGPIDQAIDFSKPPRFTGSLNDDRTLT